MSIEQSPIDGRLQLRHLRSLVWIVEAGSLSRAALRHHIAQPALSRQLAELEHALGVPLLDRGPHGARPTEAGERLYREAQAILRQVGQIPGVLRTDAGALGGKVVVELPSSLVFRLALPLATQVAARHPRVAVEVTSGHSAERVMDDVRDGDIDMALLLGAGRPADVERRDLFRQRLFLLRRRSDGGPAGPVDRAELAATPLLIVSGLQGVRERTEALLAEIGAQPRIVGVFETFWAQLAAVRRGEGACLTVSGDLAWIPDAADLVTRPIEPPLYLTASIITPSGRRLAPAALAVQDVLVALLLDAAATGAWPGVGPLPTPDRSAPRP